MNLFSKKKQEVKTYGRGESYAPETRQQAETAVRSSCSMASILTSSKFIKNRFFQYMCMRSQVLVKTPNTGIHH